MCFSLVLNGILKGSDENDGFAEVVFKIEFTKADGGAWIFLSSNLEFYEIGEIGVDISHGDDSATCPGITARAGQNREYQSTVRICHSQETLNHSSAVTSFWTSLWYNNLFISTDPSYSLQISTSGVITQHGYHRD